MAWFLFTHRARSLFICGKCKERIAELSELSIWTEGNRATPQVDYFATFETRIYVGKNCECVNPRKRLGLILLSHVGKSTGNSSDQERCTKHFHAKAMEIHSTSQDSQPAYSNQTPWVGRW